MSNEFNEDDPHREPQKKLPPLPPNDRDDYSDEPLPTRTKSSLPLILAIVAVVFVFCGGGIVALLVGLMLPAVAKVRQAAQRVETTNNLKMIGIGIQNYHDTHNEMVHNQWDATQKQQLYSWRGNLLPYLEQENLYSILNKNKPWNDPANAPVSNASVSAYHRHRQANDQNLTYFQAFMGPGAILDPKSPRKGRLNGQKAPLTLSAIKDGVSNTIFCVESGNPVNYLQPIDLAFPGNSVPTLGSDPNAKTFHALLCDGSVKSIQKSSATAQALSAWVVPDDGMVAPIE